MDKRQQIFCVSHEPPLVPQALFDYAIGIGDYHPARGAHIGTLDRFWDQMRPRAYGAAGNYVIPRAIDRESHRTHLTGILSHRKVIVRNPIGNPTPRCPAYREISVSMAESLSPLEVSPRDNYPFLVGAPLRFQETVVQQYAHAHYAIDLIDYLSIAVQMKVLSAQEVQYFFRETLFITGGAELGIYPTPWLYDTLSKLEQVGREFLIRCGGRIQTYDSYQVRAVGFLAERLGSFLLLSELRKRYPQAIPPAVFGQLCVIVLEGEGGYVVATAKS